MALQKYHYTTLFFKGEAYVQDLYGTSAVLCGVPEKVYGGTALEQLVPKDLISWSRDPEFKTHGYCAKCVQRLLAKRITKEVL